MGGTRSSRIALNLCAGRENGFLNRGSDVHTPRLSVFQVRVFRFSPLRHKGNSQTVTARIA